MKINSKLLAGIVVIFVFGGIAFSSAIGWWVTESNKQPVTFAEGEFAGQANPADIRGSYTFGDIARSFDVTPEILAQAFGVSTVDASTFAVKDLEAIYLNSGFEIGTGSVRLFVAYYTGLPFDTTGQEIYLPRSAADILLAGGNLYPEQIAYLEKYTVTSDVPAPVAEPASLAIPVTVVPPSTANSGDHIIKGKTTFGELLSWGVSQPIMEELIGASMPDPAMTVKDFASANGLDFEALKSALQVEVDRVKQ